MSEGRVRNLPTRTCVGCGERAPKGDLLRMICGAGGVVQLDTRGRMDGRGAYVHPKVACLAKAESARALGRAFRGRARRLDEGVLIEEAKRVVGWLEIDDGAPGSG